MTRATRIPFVNASGSLERMGRTLGRECARTAASFLKTSKSDLQLAGVPWESAKARAQEFLPYAKEYDPGYLDFMRGYSSSSGISFEDLFTLICHGERGLCTDVAVNADATSDGCIYSAHTEDWRPADEGHVVLVHGEPEKGPSYIVATLAGLELVTGINSAGISYSGNSLYQNDTRAGVPKMFMSRRLLAAKRLGEAVSAVTPLERASSYNTNICHSSGEICSVEGSATDFSVLSPECGYLLHTNHYLAAKMMQYETHFSGPTGTGLESGAGSIVRLHRAETLVRRKLGGINPEVLAGILTDHVNYPDSICGHLDKRLPELERSKTIYAVISDLTNLEMRICLGNPCEGRWAKYGLR